MFEINNLTRTVHGVAEQGQVDDAVFCFGHALHDGEVLLLDGVIRKLLLLGVIGLCGLCYEDDARCVHV